MHQVNVLGSAQLLGYVERRDFTCQTLNRVFVCAPRSRAVLDGYMRLQTVLRSAAAAMVAAGYARVPADLAALRPDGRVGPTTALGAQFIAATFAGTVAPPPEVAAILETGLSDQDVIRRVAAAADVLASYFEATLRDHPEVVRNDPIVIVKNPPRRYLSPLMIPIGLSAGLATAGIVALTIYLRSRSSVFSGR